MQVDLEITPDQPVLKNRRLGHRRQHIDSALDELAAHRTVAICRIPDQPLGPAIVWLLIDQTSGLRAVLISTILRWALCEAAQHTPTGGGPLRARYGRIAKRRGSKIAKVAVARQILTLCYYGLRDGEIRCLTHQPTDIDTELAEVA